MAGFMVIYTYIIQIWMYNINIIINIKRQLGSCFPFVSFDVFCSNKMKCEIAAK